MLRDAAVDTRDERRKVGVERSELFVAEGSRPATKHYEIASFGIGRRPVVSLVDVGKGGVHQDLGEVEDGEIETCAPWAPIDEPIDWVKRGSPDLADERWVASAIAEVPW